MNNFVNSPLNNTTPIRRVGLSRKRKSFGVCGDSLKENTAEGSVRKMPKQDGEVSKVKETNLKCDGDKTQELEILYSTWRNGCKAAFLYLLDKLKEVQGEKVDVKKLLSDLGVLNVMSNHFSSDSDFDFFTCDGDSPG